MPLRGDCHSTGTFYQLQSHVSYTHLKLFVSQIPFAVVQSHNFGLSTGRVEVSTHFRRTRGLYCLPLIIGGGGDITTYIAHSLHPWGSALNFFVSPFSLPLPNMHCATCKIFHIRQYSDMDSVQELMPKKNN